MTRYWETRDRGPACHSWEHAWQPNGRCFNCRWSKDDLIMHCQTNLQQLAPERLAEPYRMKETADD